MIRKYCKGKGPALSKEAVEADSGRGGVRSDLFSPLLEEFPDQLHRLFRRVGGMDEMGSEIGKQT